MESNEKIAYRVSVNTIIQNIILSIFKLFAGIFGHSASMISDAIHSASDVFSTLVVIIGVKISAKKADEKHPYGHEKLECISSIILAMLLFSTAVGIGLGGAKSVIQIINGTLMLRTPGTIALIASIASILVKEAMYHYTVRAARKIKSNSMLADAWHHRSDAISSIGAFVGILGAMLGWPVLDPLVSVLIALLIIKVAFDICLSSVNQMVDTAAPQEVQDEIRRIVLSFEDVYEIDFIKTRLFGNRIYTDIELQLDKNLTLKQAHDIIEEIHDEIEEKIVDIKHCMIHANPTK